MSEQAAENLKAQLQRDLEAVRAEDESYRARLEETAASSRSSRRLRDAGDREAPGAGTGTDSGTTVLADRSMPADQRVEVLHRLGVPLGRGDDFIVLLLRLVRDRDDDPSVREAALQLLGSAAFQVLRFEPFRPDYVDALRDLLTDPVDGLRTTAAITLAQEHDPVAQQMLLAGVRGDGTLPVERGLAIRLLAEDDHLDNLPLLQELYASDSADDRQEAVRFMASYPAAADDLERIMRDRAEAGDVRAASSVSLRQLAPGRFESAAKEIATDAGEHSGVRMASLSALQLTAPEGRVHDDPGFVRALQAVGDDESTPELAQAARDLLAGAAPEPRPGE